MRVMLGHVALFPGMPSAERLCEMANTLEGFPAVSLPGLPNSYFGEPVEIVSFVLARWPACPELRRHAAVMRVGTLTQLHAIPGIPSIETLRGLIAKHREFPLIERGDRSKPYRLDLPIAAAFVLSVWSDGRTVERRRKDGRNVR